MHLSAGKALHRACERLGFGLSLESVQDILCHVSDQVAAQDPSSSPFTHASQPVPSEVSAEALAAVLQPEVDAYLQRLHRIPPKNTPSSSGRPPRPGPSTLSSPGSAGARNAAAAELPGAFAAGRPASPASDGSVDIESLEAGSPTAESEGGWEPVDGGGAAVDLHQATNGQPVASTVAVDHTQLPPLPQSRGTSSLASSAPVSPPFGPRQGGAALPPGTPEASLEAQPNMAAAVRQKLPSHVQSFLADARGWSAAGKPVKEDSTAGVDEEGGDSASSSSYEDDTFEDDQGGTQSPGDDLDQLNISGPSSRHYRGVSSESGGGTSEAPYSPVSRLASGSTYAAMDSTRSQGMSHAGHWQEAPAPAGDVRSSEQQTLQPEPTAATTATTPAAKAASGIATTSATPSTAPAAIQSAAGGFLSPELSALLAEMEGESNGLQGGNLESVQPAQPPRPVSPLTESSYGEEEDGEADDFDEAPMPRALPPSQGGSRQHHAPPTQPSDPAEELSLRLLARGLTPNKGSGVALGEHTGDSTPIPARAPVVAAAWTSPPPFSGSLARVAQSTASTAAAPATAAAHSPTPASSDSSDGRSPVAYMRDARETAQRLRSERLAMQTNGTQPTAEVPTGADGGDAPGEGGDSGSDGPPTTAGSVMSLEQLAFSALPSDDSPTAAGAEAHGFSAQKPATQPASSTAVTAAAQPAAVPTSWRPAESSPATSHALATAHRQLDTALDGMQSRLAAVLARTSVASSVASPVPSSAVSRASTPPSTRSHGDGKGTATSAFSAPCSVSRGSPAVSVAKGGDEKGVQGGSTASAGSGGYSTILSLQNQLMRAMDTNNALKRQLEAESSAKGALESELHTALEQLDTAADALEASAQQAKRMAAEQVQSKRQLEAINRGQGGSEQATRRLLGVAMLWRQVWLMNAVASAAGLAGAQSVWLQRLLAACSQRASVPSGQARVVLNLGSTAQIIPSPVLAAAKAIAAASEQGGGAVQGANTDVPLQAAHVATACTVVMPCWAASQGHAAITALALGQLGGGSTGSAARPTDFNAEAIVSACKAVASTQFLASVKGEVVPPPDTDSVKGLITVGEADDASSSGFSTSADGEKPSSKYGAMIGVEGVVDVRRLAGRTPKSGAEASSFSLPTPNSADGVLDMTVSQRNGEVTLVPSSGLSDADGGLHHVLPTRAFRFPVTRFIGPLAPPSTLVQGASSELPEHENLIGDAPSLGVLCSALAGGMLDVGVVLSACGVDAVQGAAGRLHGALLDTMWKGVTALRTAGAVEAAASVREGGHFSSEGVRIGLSYCACTDSGETVDLLQRDWDASSPGSAESAVHNPHVVTAPTLPAAKRCAELGFRRRMDWSTRLLKTHCSDGRQSAGAAAVHTGGNAFESPARGAAGSRARRLPTSGSSRGGYCEREAPGGLAPHPTACAYTHGVLRLHLLRQRGQSQQAADFDPPAPPLRADMSELRSTYDIVGTLVLVELGPNSACIPRAFGQHALTRDGSAPQLPCPFATCVHAVWQANSQDNISGATAADAGQVRPVAHGQGGSHPLARVLEASLRSGRCAVATVATAGPDIPQLLHSSGLDWEGDEGGLSDGASSAEGDSATHRAQPSETAAKGGFVQYGSVDFDWADDGVSDSGRFSNGTPEAPSPRVGHRSSSRQSPLEQYVPGTAQYTLLSSLLATPPALRPFAFATCFAATASVLPSSSGGSRHPGTPAGGDTLPWAELISTPAQVERAMLALGAGGRLDEGGQQLALRGPPRGSTREDASVPQALANLAKGPARRRPLALQGGVGSAVGDVSDSGSVRASSRRNTSRARSSTRPHGAPRLGTSQRRQRTQANIAAREAHAAAAAAGKPGAVRRGRGVRSRSRGGSVSSADDGLSVSSSLPDSASQLGRKRKPGTSEHMTSQQVQYTAMMAAAVAAAAAARQEADGHSGVHPQPTSPTNDPSLRSTGHPDGVAAGTVHRPHEGVSDDIGSVGQPQPGHSGTPDSSVSAAMYRRESIAQGGNTSPSIPSSRGLPPPPQQQQQQAASELPATAEPTVGGDPVPGMRKLLSTAQLASGSRAVQPEAFRQLLQAFRSEHAALMAAGAQPGAQAGHVAWARRQAQNTHFGAPPTLPPQAFAAGLRGLVPSLEPMDAWALVRSMHLEREADIDFTEFTEALQTLAGASQQAVHDTLAISQRSELSSLDEELARELAAASRGGDS